MPWMWTGVKNEWRDDKEDTRPKLPRPEIVPSPVSLEDDTGVLRTFKSGATRDSAEGKFDYEGFLSPQVIEAFGAYMNFNRLQSNGEVRDSDNWQKGIPFTSYMKSLWRHVLSLWKEHRLIPSDEGIVWACCGIIFNAQGYLLEALKEDPHLLKKSLIAAENRRRVAWENKKEVGFLSGKVGSDG